MYPKLTKGKPNQVFSLNRIKSSKIPIKSNWIFNEIVIPRFGWNFSLPGLGACGRV